MAIQKQRKKAKRSDKAKLHGPTPTPLHKRSKRQHAFIDAYLAHLNATKAAIEAGYSETSAKFEGSRLLADPVLSDEIQRRIRIRADEAAVTTAEVVRQLREIVFFDIAELVDPRTNKLRKIHDIPEHVRRAMQGIELVVCFGEITGIKPVAASKGKHMELLMRHMGMLGTIEKASGPTVQFDVHFHAPGQQQQAPAVAKPAGRAPVTIEADAVVADFGLPQKAIASR